MAKVRTDTYLPTSLSYFSPSHTNTFKNTVKADGFVFTAAFLAGRLAHPAWYWTRDPSSHIMWPAGGRSSRHQRGGRWGNLQGEHPQRRHVLNIGMTFVTSKVRTAGSGVQLSHLHILFRRFLALAFLSVFCPALLISVVSLQRNGGLFGNHVNHVGDEQGTSHPTTVTQRPLQILPFCPSASFEPTQTDRGDSSHEGEGETEINSSPIQYNHHYHPPHPYNYPNCNSTGHQSPIPSNANLNNANVPSLLSMTNRRQQKCLLRRDRPSSIKNQSSVSTYSREVQEKSWKSQSTRSVHRNLPKWSKLDKRATTWAKKQFLQMNIVICS